MSQLGDLVPDAAAAKEGVILEKEGVAKLTAPFLIAIANHRFHERQTHLISA